MNNLLVKLTVAGTASVAVSETVSLEPLWNALITLAISVVSVLTIDGIAWLKSFIKKHTDKDKEQEEKGDEGNGK